jgi:hypothetical protein
LKLFYLILMIKGKITQKGNNMWLFLENFRNLIQNIRTNKFNFNNILLKFFKQIIYLIVLVTLHKGVFKVFNIILFKVKILNKNGKQYRLFKIVLSRELKKFIQEYDPLAKGANVMDSLVMLESHFDTLDNKKKKFIKTDGGDLGAEGEIDGLGFDLGGNDAEDDK